MLVNLRRWEWWLNKVGIALFLTGVVFLFEFSWDREWLQFLVTPVVRVGLGIVLGSALVWVGLRVYADRRALAQVVLGGGIGTYYTTGFAAFQMLGVFSYPLAFAFMTAVTLLSFALALRQNGAALALIGVSGGFATPFSLYDGEGALGGLVLYGGFVLAGALGTYLYKGWRSLLIVSFGGYWTVVFSAGAVPVGTPSIAEGIALQAGVLFGWAAPWLMPATREVLRPANPARWRVPEIGIPVRALLGGYGRLSKDGAPAYLLSFASPLAALWMTQHLWDTGRTTMGLLALGIAVAHVLARAGFRRVEVGGRVSYAQATVALLFATLSLVLLLQGQTLLLVLAAEAAALHFVARRLSDRVISLVAHALFAGVGAWAFSLLVVGALANLLDPYHAVPAPFFNVQGLVGLAVTALAFASTTALAASESRRAYRTLGHAAVALLLLRELVPFGGGAYALAALALYAAGLHLLSRRRPEWGTTGGAHALSVFIGLWLSARLALDLFFLDDFAWSLPGPWDLWGLADPVVIAAILASSWLVGGRKTVLFYRIAAHASLLAWFWRELEALPGSPDAYVTLAWGFCGAAMFVAGLRRDHAYLIKGGVATLFLVVAKLSLWDLAGLEPVWRVLLFLGFGGLFLLLSYHLRNLWNPADGDGTPKDTPELHAAHDQFQHRSP